MDAITNTINEPSSDDAAADLIILETIDDTSTTIEEDKKSETTEIQCVVEDVMDFLCYFGVRITVARGRRRGR